MNTASDILNVDDATPDVIAIIGDFTDVEPEKILPGSLLKKDLGIGGAPIGNGEFLDLAAAIANYFNLPGFKTAPFSLAELDTITVKDVCDKVNELLKQQSEKPASA